MSNNVDAEQLLLKSKRVLPVGKQAGLVAPIRSLEQLHEDAKLKTQANSSIPAMNHHDVPIMHHPVAQRLERSVANLQCVVTPGSQQNATSAADNEADWNLTNTAVYDYFKNKFTNAASRTVEETLDDANRFYAQTSHMQLFSLWERTRPDVAAAGGFKEGEFVQVNPYKF